MNRIQTRSLSNAKLSKEAAEAVSGSQLANCIDNGKSTKKTHDEVLYIHGELTGGNTIFLFKDLVKDKAEIGITNFDGNQLNQGKNAVIDAISIEIGVSADGSQTATQVEYGTKADLAIQNAEFTFSVDGNDIINLPVWEAHNPNTTRTNDEKYRDLGHLPVIEAMKPCEATFKFPTGVTPDATGGKKHFVRVALRVLKTVSR